MEHSKKSPVQNVRCPQAGRGPQKNPRYMGASLVEVGERKKPPSEREAADDSRRLAGAKQGSSYPPLHYGSWGRVSASDRDGSLQPQVGSLVAVRTVTRVVAVPFSSPHHRLVNRGIIPHLRAVVHYGCGNPDTKLSKCLRIGARGALAGRQGRRGQRLGFSGLREGGY